MLVNTLKVLQNVGVGESKQKNINITAYLQKNNENPGCFA